MLLELDVGNTRCKWRLLKGGEPFLRGALATVELSRGNLPRAWRDAQPERVRAASVAGEGVAAQLATTLRGELGVEVDYARVQAICAGVTCGYREVAKLGVDRWLAVLAAYHREPRTAMIVDCGSAVTIDLVDNGGQHLGGYILPGLGLMHRALYRDTDAVKVEEEFLPGMPLSPGQDTDEAVNRGLPLMVLGAMEQALLQLREPRRQEPRVWLTGGDGDFISSLYSRPHELVPELVLDGLEWSNPWRPV